MVLEILMRRSELAVGAGECVEEVEKDSDRRRDVSRSWESKGLVGPSLDEVGACGDGMMPVLVISSSF